MTNIYLISFLLLLTFVSKAQQSDVSKEKLDIDSISLLLKNSYEAPGLAIGIILDNQPYYLNALGVQDVDSETPLSTTSLFHMASVSKPFVATAIMQLVEAGKMNLEDKLVDHLPYFAMKDKRYRDITIKQILNHSSGIPDVEDYEWDKPQYDDGAAERYARSFTEDELDFAPGETFNYSNASFDILAAVIANVSGLSFEEYMTKYIFEPTGMVHSTFYKPDVPKALATKPHDLGDDLRKMEIMEIYPYNRMHAPSSTLHSNIEDMTRWAMLYLNKGRIDGKQVFSEETYALLTSPTLQLNESNSVCLSWFTRELDGKAFYNHSGGDEGYRTFFGFFPETKSAIILMANNDYFQSSSVANFLANVLVVQKPTSWKRHIQFELKNLMLTEGIDHTKAFFYHAKQHLNDQYYFGGGGIDQLGYWFLDRKKYQEALEIFLFNVELFPEDAGFFDSVGDAYMEMNNKAKAIEWYEKALEMNPEQGFTIEKLNKLKE